MPNRFCAIIPHYNHAGTIGAVLRKLAAASLPIIVVDDGSDETSLKAVRQYCADVAGELIELQPNVGKGAASISAMRAA